MHQWRSHPHGLAWPGELLALEINKKLYFPRRLKKLKIININNTFSSHTRD